MYLKQTEIQVWSIQDAKIQKKREKHIKNDVKFCKSAFNTFFNIVYVINNQLLTKKLQKRLKKNQKKIYVVSKKMPNFAPF